jgi:hypothetical protein
MEEQQVDIQAVLKNLREIIGVQAQEIAVLKATLEAYTANS